MRVEFNPKKCDVLLYQLAGYSFIRKFLKPTDHVLDVGCGEGYTTRFLSEKCNVIGIDIDRKLMHENQEKYGSDDCYFDIRSFSLINLHYGYNNFDIVICRDIIEHLPKDEGEELIKELSNALRYKSSMLFLGTVREGVISNRPKDQGHIHEYNYKELKSLLEAYFERVVFFSQTDEIVTLTEPKEMCWRWIVMCWGKK